MGFKFIRPKQAISLSGECRSQLYQNITDRLFPRPVRLTGRSTGWPDYEIEAIQKARLAGKSDDEIRELVIELEAARSGDVTNPDPDALSTATEN